jgi:transposase
MRGKHLLSGLSYKRLERDRFPWPRNEEAAREITVDQLRMLLDGVDFWKAHQKLAYTTVL